jgi:LCP family protein required for cell wall assembly
MRTTLKKGTRGAGNGNGSGVVPAVALDLPFEPSPRSGYRMPRRNPLVVVGKFFLWVVIVLLVVAGGLAGGVQLYFDYSVAAIRPHTREVKEAQKFLAEPVPGQPAVAILIGYDQRFGRDAVLGSRSDTVMLLRADPKKKVVTLLSFPRDLAVDIVGCRGHSAFHGRINEAYTYCGPRGTLQTVKQLTGIPINYMITVNFRAFTKIVDRLGGVYLDIDRRYFNDNAGASGGSGYAKINLKPGYQKLDGSRALDFVRYRHTDSDLYRVVRQQEFVKAFKQQISSTWSVLQLPGMVNTITQNVEVAKGGKKELEPGEVRGYAKLLYELPAGNFQQVELEGIFQEEGSFELGVSDESLDEAVQRFLRPDANAPDKAISAATGRKPKGPQGPPASTVTLEVQNGNGELGAAADATYLLGRRGYQAVNGSNADSFDYFHTLILYDPLQADAKLAAEGVGLLFGDADIREAAPDDGLETMLRVIVGETFQGTLAPSPRDTTPEHKPPAVVRDDGSIVPVLRPIQRKLDFTLYLPTIREQTSVLSEDEGVRAYRVDKHRALRLTYRTSTNEYWGIQETSWTDPPILGGATLVRTIKGREYKLYLSGSKLHMVAFEENGATYWVVNTLLNRLSNETMLAIARGLRPLGGAR